MVPVTTTSKAVFASGSGLSLQGMVQRPPYPGGEALFTPTNPDEGAKIKAPLRGAITPEGWPSMPGTMFPPVGGKNGFIPDMGPPSQATFHPTSSPTSVLRGTYTEQTSASGASNFTLISEDAARMPSGPTPGTLVTTSGSDGDGILGVFVPPDLFKPDLRQGGGGGAAAEGTGEGGTTSTGASGSGAQQGLETVCLLHRNYIEITYVEIF